MPIIHTARPIFESTEKIIAHPVNIEHWKSGVFVPFTLGSVEYIKQHPHIFANLRIKENGNINSQAAKTALKNLRDYALEQDCINEIAFVEVTDDLRDVIKAILGDYTVHVYRNIPFPKIPKIEV